MVNCEFIWASDDSFIAMKYTPFDGELAGDEKLLAMSQANLTSWNDLYVLNAATHEICMVAQTPDFKRYGCVLAMTNVVLAPNCRYPRSASCSKHSWTAHQSPY